MESFEELLKSNRCAVERFVRFRIGEKFDADDVLQETYLAAFQNFNQLKNIDSFKFWIISIARNKCNDYFREKAARSHIPTEIMSELTDSRYGVSEISVVRETLKLLSDKDKQVLYLYFWKQLPIAEISKLLGLPLGTVKSRLFTAKRNFKDRYPYQTDTSKGEIVMKKLPEFLPEYVIEKIDEIPFSVKWEEIMGWFIVPKAGEKLRWGMYESPSGKCIRLFDMKVTGKAMVHGIEGVRLTAKETVCSGKGKDICHAFIVQLTETHCRYLATVRDDGDIKKYITFLDGDEFMLNWGFGEDNCGNETNLSPKGDIRRTGNIVTASDKAFLLDIVGRYRVTIAGKTFDTVCVMNIEKSGVATEQFLDKNGRTVLWRRFNRDDWAIDRYKHKWSELLPSNEQLLINGEIFVHWDDCITDYIL